MTLQRWFCGDGELFKHLAKFQLLIIDDFGLTPPDFRTFLVGSCDKVNRINGLRFLGTTLFSPLRFAVVNGPGAGFGRSLGSARIDGGVEIAREVKGAVDARGVEGKGTWHAVFCMGAFVLQYAGLNAL
jgi:hypothetical protein